jgi:hypothetical protein
MTQGVDCAADVPLESVGIGVAVLHSECLVSVLVAELGFTPPPKLALLCFRENVAGREYTVPCDLCDVIAEPGFCVARCPRPRALRYPALRPDVRVMMPPYRSYEKTPTCPWTLAILTSALSCSQRNVIIDARSAVASSQVWCCLAIPSE